MLKINKLICNIEKIATSGQAFRFHKYQDGHGYRVVSQNKILTILDFDENHLICRCEPQHQEYWKNYFDMYYSYENIIASVSKDNVFLYNAVQYGKGLRILKQDLWETIISFIISQNNNIPKIRRTINLLCQQCGDTLQYGLYGFPNVEQILNANCQEKLSGIGLGYRKDYITNLSCMVLEGEFDLEYLKTLNYEEAKAMLMSIRGVGAKVADCICLYGLHHIDAFPIDTHMKDILYREFYTGHLTQDKLKMKDYQTIVRECFPLYDSYKGILQQYMFDYERYLCG